VGVSKKLADDSDFQIWTDYCPEVDLSEPPPHSDTPETPSKSPNRAFRSIKTQIMTGKSQSDLTPTKTPGGITPFKYGQRMSSFSSISDSDASPLKFGQRSSPRKKSGMTCSKGSRSPSKKKTEANFMKKTSTVKFLTDEKSPGQQKKSDDHRSEISDYESPDKNEAEAKTFENFSG
jgi:hypothetical protein